MEAYGWDLIDNEVSHWEIDTTKNLAAFLRALPIISPPSAIIYFEAGTPDEEISGFFGDRGVPGAVIPMGSADPNPFYHLPVTADNLEALARIAERHAECEIAAHIHVYRGPTIYLQWYDAFWDPILVSEKIPEEEVKQFSCQLSLKYRKAMAPGID